MHCKSLWIKASAKCRNVNERKMVLFFPPILQEHFYDAASGSGYLAWRLKTVQRNNSCHTERKNKPNSEQGGPNIRRYSSLEHQLEGDALVGDALVEAISLLAHTGVEETIFEKMRQTFRYRQELVHNADMATNILNTFPRFLDTKGLVSNI